MKASRAIERDAGSADFDDFYRTEAAGQIRRAALLTGSDELANDIVHDAFAAMFPRWGEIEAPGPYLNRAVLNGCRDAGRRRTVQRRLLDRLRVHGPDVVDVDHLDDALGRLPFNHRAAVVLRYYSGASTAEIAELLACPTGSVGPWIDRGLTALRRELQ